VAGNFPFEREQAHADELFSHADVVGLAAVRVAKARCPLAGCGKRDFKPGAVKHF
jgi:hypothetical protein